MAGNLTFTMIKPGAIAAGYTGPIIERIEKEGYKIIAMKLTRFTSGSAGRFYGIHKGKPFYDNLIEYMTSGNVIAIVLQKENAVTDYRKLIGATNPANAEDNTLRKLYAKDGTDNAVHGSDSDENALKEAYFFFSDLEFFED